MTMRTVLLLSVALYGQVRSQCEPFNQASNIDASIASNAVCTTGADGSVGLGDEAPENTLCVVTCPSDTHPPIVPANPAVNLAYRCEKQLPNVAENGCSSNVYTWVSQLGDGVPITCLAPQCPPLGDLLGVSTVTCDGNPVTDATTYGANLACTVTGCDTGYELSAASADVTFTCTADGMTSVAAWDPPSSEAACVPDQCESFATYLMAADGGNAPPGIEAAECGGDSASINVGVNVGVTCTVACTDTTQGLSDTTGFTCGPGGTWTSPDPLPTCMNGCAAPSAMTNPNDNTGGFDASQYANADVTCTTPAPASSDLSLDQVAVEGTVCTVTCREGEGYVFATGSTNTLACANSAWPAVADRPVCTQVACPAFDSIDISGAVRGMCNDLSVAGGDLCAFGAATTATAWGTACQVTCPADFELANEREALYTCNAIDPDNNAMGMWTSEAACNPACSEAAITSDDGAYSQTCCASRTSGTCPVDYAGCETNDQCDGALVCGDAGTSCSPRINDAVGPDVQARCCVSATPAPTPSQSPDTAGPCSPEAITADNTWGAACCAAEGVECGLGYGGCADDDECTGDLVCGQADSSCSDDIKAAAGDMANMTRCCANATATNPDPTDAPPVDGATALHTRFVALLVAVVSVVTFVFTV